MDNKDKETKQERPWLTEEQREYIKNNPNWLLDCMIPLDKESKGGN